ncbi:hypothetical protein TNCV_2707881 [Trichonephila clavipes]|nr:hypothetical protein TNCV_2707881 [Trichonephila clavipes]
MFDPSSFANPTPLAHADTSRDVLPRGGTSQTFLINRINRIQRKAQAHASLRLRCLKPFRSLRSTRSSLLMAVSYVYVFGTIFLESNQSEKFVPSCRSNGSEQLFPSWTPPIFRRGTRRERYILQPPALMVSAVTAHKTFGLTDLTNMYSVCTRRVFGGIGHRTQAFRSGLRCSNH